MGLFRNMGTSVLGMPSTFLLFETLVNVTNDLDSIWPITNLASL